MNMGQPETATAVPSSFAIDRDGRLIEAFMGPSSDELLAGKVGRRL